MCACAVLNNSVTTPLQSNRNRCRGDLEVSSSPRWTATNPSGKVSMIVAGCLGGVSLKTKEHVRREGLTFSCLNMILGIGSLGFVGQKLGSQGGCVEMVV